MIQYPMASRFIVDNVSAFESQFIQPYMTNFDELIALFKIAKDM